MFSSWKLCCAKIPQRWIFAVMGSLAAVNAYTMRISLSLAITEMVKSTESNDTSADATCPSTDSASTTSTISSGTYDWDEYTQGIILSSFYWGYIVTQIPGGILADKVGGKYTLGIGILSTAIFTLLTPIVVEAFDSVGLIVLRVLMGLGEGTTFPAINALLARWAPPLERSTIGTIVMIGVPLGTILGNTLTGVLIQHSSIGWPMVFYFFGGVSVVWFCAWVVLCYNEPDSHPFISEAEKKYLHESTKEHTHKQNQPTPWRHILTSVPFWALLVGKFGHDWGFYTMVTDLPKYMSNVLKFSIASNGLLLGIPYFAMWVSGIAASWVADWLIKSERMSTTNVRKICTTIASVGPAVFIISASYVGCDRIVVIIFFTIGMGMMGLFYPGMMVNGTDLSPNHSGVLMALMTVDAAVAGMTAPLAVGVLTPNQTLSEWRIVFWVTFVILTVSNMIFILWADGEVQYWNEPNFQLKMRNNVSVNRADPKNVTENISPVS